MTLTDHTQQTFTELPPFNDYDAVLATELRIDDFQIRITSPRRLRAEAAGLIFSRWRSNQQLYAEMVRNRIEIGMALEAVYLTYNDPTPNEYNQLAPAFRVLCDIIRAEKKKNADAYNLSNDEPQTYKAWLKKHFPGNEDTAKNYRNLAERIQPFLARIAAGEFARLTDDELQRTELGALYKLAVKEAGDEAISWFFIKLMDDKSIKGDMRLSTIARHPEIRARVDTGELNIDQAVSLIEAKPNVDPRIWLVCEQAGVKYGEVVVGLDDLYKDYLKAPESARPNKTWAEIEHNQHRLVWRGKDNIDYDVPLSKANPGDLLMYMQYRRETKTLGNGRQRQDATAEVRWIDGRPALLLLDAKAIPPGFSGNITIGLYPDSWQIDPAQNEESEF